MIRTTKVNELIDPAITGGFVALALGAFKSMEVLASKIKNGGNGRVTEAEWRTKVTMLLERQGELMEKQVELLQQHNDACASRISALRDVLRGK